MNVLVTGSAGFIGSNLVLKLLRTVPDVNVTGLDNITPYYDTSLKRHRLDIQNECAAQHPQARYGFIEGSIADRDLLERTFNDGGFDVVVHLAAQTGVRHSISHPDDYVESNIIGFYNILEECRRHPVKHLVFASSSSVYGNRDEMPLRECERTDSPESLYGATKKSGEVMAHSYSKLFGIPCTGLRFFTVYGPAGRPDMAYFSFTDKLRRGEKIQLFNYGDCRRDFTFIDDIVEGISRVVLSAPKAPFSIYNIGNSHPENLKEFVVILAEELCEAGVLPQGFDIEGHLEYLPMQAGDVKDTFADTSALRRDFGFSPSTPLRDGIRAFARWYKDYYDKQTTI